jgi:hypothetical protein
LLKENTVQDTPGSSLQLGVVSDTHGLARPELFSVFAGAHAILHAGDVGDDDVLLDLRAIAPTHAVRGNVDGPQYPERLEVVFAGKTFGMAHGHLFAGKGRVKALLSAFPHANFVLYGHTHQAHFEQIGHVTVINPGSAGPKRFSQPVTAGILELRAETWDWKLYDLETGTITSEQQG